ncbi:MAG: pilus assembly protein [Alphaproteobacteria bacterium]|nr:pilus assembly protein [Alphaproteobacteria bacterium]
MLRRLYHYFANRDGATVMEFALVGPILVLLLMGALEFGLLLWATAVLDTATASGARLGKIGFNQSFISTEMDRLSAGLLDPARLSIQESSYSSFSSLQGGGAGASGTGSGGDAVVYTVTYPWPIFTPLLQHILPNTQGNYIITVTTAVRNEPFTP